MRIPFTDKFLWDLYNATEGIEKMYSYGARRSLKEAVYPELWKMRKEYERKRRRKDFSQFVYYLKKKGYIRIKNLEQTEGVVLTEKGLERLTETRKLFVERKKRKDGRWQMIIFDIPEEKRKLRRMLREYLSFLGYEMLQQSVWVCPYDVEKETEEFLREYSIDPYVKLFLIKQI
ncbi:MAG TPA: CRISPR-associated endonuclease Cas2 [Candidatus Paceibacterota bacterium]